MTRKPAPAMTARQRFLRALASEPVDRPPAWIMRQAGRYLPEYRALRRQHSFLDAVHSPELAAEITLQPLRRFPLDAAILFSDILTVLEAAGLEVTFPEGGPRVHPSLSDADASGLQPVDVEKDLGYVARALRLVRDEVGEERAVLGFAGAPFTLACYAILGAGGKDFAPVRGLMLSRPEAFSELLEVLARIVADLLVMQVRAGADAVQLFDTWAGTLSERDFRCHLAPHLTRILSAVRDAGGRTILYVKDGGHLLHAALDCRPDVLGIDWRVDVAAAADAAAGRAALQGNLDPAALFAPAAEIRGRVNEIHEAVGGKTGHVFNLGHGIVPSTPISGVEAFLAAVGALGGRP